MNRLKKIALVLNEDFTESLTTLILDEFTDTDGVVLSAHTISPTNVPGASWTYIGGDVNYVRVLSNKIHSHAGSFKSIYSLDVGEANCKLSADYTCGIGLCGFSLRIMDYDNYIYVYIDGSTERLVFYRRIAGTSTLLKSFDISSVYTGGNVVLFTVTLSDSLITANFGDLTTDVTEVALKTNTKHGVYFGGGNECYLDNYTVNF